MQDTFGKSGSEEQVEGLTLIIDGKLKEVFDAIMEKSTDYQSYTEILSQVVLHGVNEIIEELN